MPDDITTTVLAYVGMATLAFIILRLLSAPYFVWKVERQRADAAEAVLAKPSRDRDRLLKENLIDALARLRTKVADLPIGANYPGLTEGYFEAADNVKYHLERLSHADNWFKAGHHNMHLCNIIMHCKMQIQDYRTYDEELVASTRKLHALLDQS